MGGKSKMFPDVKDKTSSSVKGIGIRIKDRRLALGLSTRDFSQGIPGLQSSNLSEIERGERRPTINILVGISHKYGIPVSELVGQDDDGRAAMGVRVSTKLLPVYNEKQVNALLGKNEEGFMLEGGGVDRYYPAATEDSLSFYYVTQRKAIFGCCKDRENCPGNSTEMVCPGDFLLIEPRRKIEDGDPVLATGGGKVLICNINNPDNEDDVILVHDATVTRLSPQKAKNYKFYRISAVVKPL
jgi:transcriptional regulator with XRE-family HTH domain